MWGATQTIRPARGAERISIHAPRVGGDPVQRLRRGSDDPISIHAPRVGGDHADRRHRHGGIYFNPRPPCGGRRKRSDLRAAQSEFQSTPPVWGATYAALQQRGLRSISIHAPRVGGDSGPTHASAGSRYFNPRPPCGGRPERSFIRAGYDGFQSTPPVWGATSGLVGREAYGTFQSTPPVWGATSGCCGAGSRPCYFNPRPPCGGRLAVSGQGIHGLLISIHAPRVGGDVFPMPPAVCDTISIHAPRVGGDALLQRDLHGVHMISIHAPRVGGDPSGRSHPSAYTYFNPRPPCGGRLHNAIL